MSFIALGVSTLFAASITLGGYYFYPAVERLFLALSNEYLGWITGMNEKMFRATSRRTLALFILVSTFFFLGIGFTLSQGMGWLTLLISLASALFGWNLPRTWVKMQWHRRLLKFDLQLIDALNLMANSLKSGLNLPQSIQVLVQEMPAPLSQEFGLVLTQQKLGVTLDEALQKLADRVPSADLNLVIQSILVLRETGGDLSETFDVIASTIRERRKIDGRIKTLTAAVRTQAYLLMLLPLALVFLMYVVNPGFLLPLFQTQLGWMILAVVVVLQVLGGLWLRKIIRIEV